MKLEGPGRAGRALTVVLLVFCAAAGFSQPADNLLEAGKKAFSDGFYDVAAASFRRVVSDYPQAAAALEAEYLLGVSQFYAGKWEESISALGGFQARHPDSFLSSRAAYWIGAAQLKLGKYEKALRALGGAPGGEKRLGPYAGHAALLSGIAFEALGRDAEAAARYRGLLEPGGDASLAPEAAFRLAGIEYRAGRFPSARELYGRILISYPQSAFVRDSLFFLAESDLAVGETQSAQRRYSTILSIYPDSPYREAAMYRLADISYREKDAADALRRLDDLKAQFPRGAYSGNALRLRADIFFDQKKYEQSLAGYREAVSALPDGGEKQAAFYSAGLAELMLGRKADTAQDFGRAGSGSVKDIGERASFQRAVVLAGIGRTEEAIGGLNDYLEAFPGGPHGEEALKLLASLLDARGDYEKSAGRWTDLVKLFPRSASLPEYLFNRGSALMKRGTPGALDDFQRILRDYAGSGFRDESEYSIGYIYARRGEYSRALPYFQSVSLRAAGTEIGDRSLLSIGTCLFNMGSFDKALASLEYLRAAHPAGEMEGTVALYQGKTLYRLERLGEAVERLSAASSTLDALPSAPERAFEAADARYWLGWSLFRLGKLAESRDAFLSLAQKYPADARVSEVLYRAGICETLLGDDTAAVVLFDRSASAAGPSAGSTLEQALYEKGWALSRMGDDFRSLQAFTELSRRFPDGKLGPEAFFKISMKAFDEGRFVDARAGFGNVARDFPRSALVGQALYWSAESARQAGDAQGALDGFWLFFQQAPAENLLPAALDGLRNALASLDSIDAAEKLAARAKSAHGLDVRVAAGIQLDYARMLLAASPARALAAVADARRLSPPEPLAGEAVLLTGLCSEGMGDRRKALDLFAALSDSRIDEVGAQATLERAKALEASGSSREAVEQYLRISYVYPGFADLAAEGLFSAARLSLQQGDRENASRAQETLKKRYPDSQWAARIGELE